MDLSKLDIAMRQTAHEHEAHGKAWNELPESEQDAHMFALLDCAHVSDSHEQIIPEVLAEFAARSPRSRFELVDSLRNVHPRAVYAWVMLALRRGTARTLEQRWEMNRAIAESEDEPYALDPAEEDGR